MRATSTILTLKTLLRDAVIVVLLSAALALLANILRPSDSIALVAREAYEILVPCPEFRGLPAKPLEPGQVVLEEHGMALVDARDTEAYTAWHLPGAISIPFDYLEPRPEEKKVLMTRARRVIVYGDGDDPDTGQQLANAISSKGVKNVFYIKGGAAVLRRLHRKGRRP